MTKLLNIAIFWTFIISLTLVFGGSLLLGISIASGIQLAIQLFV